MYQDRVDADRRAATVRLRKRPAPDPGESTLSLSRLRQWISAFAWRHLSPNFAFRITVPRIAIPLRPHRVSYTREQPSGEPRITQRMRDTQQDDLRGGVRVTDSYFSFDA